MGTEPAVVNDDDAYCSHVLCVQIIQLYTYTATYVCSIIVVSIGLHGLGAFYGQREPQPSRLGYRKVATVCRGAEPHYGGGGDSAPVLGSVDEAVDCIFRVQHSLSELAIGKEPELAQDPIGNKPFIYGETGAGKSVFKRDEIVKRLRTEASSKADIPPVEMWIQLDHDLERTIWFCRKCGLEISCDAPRRNGAEGKCEKCGRLLSKHEDRCPDHPHAAVRTLGKRR